MKKLASILTVSAFALAAASSAQASPLTCQDLVSTNWNGSGHLTSYGSTLLSLHAVIPAVSFKDQGILSGTSTYKGFGLTALSGQCSIQNGIPSMHLTDIFTGTDITVTLTNATNASINGIEQTVRGSKTYISGTISR